MGVPGGPQNSANPGRIGVEPVATRDSEPCARRHVRRRSVRAVTPQLA